MGQALQNLTKIIVACVFFILLGIYSAEASHSVGADLTYTCLGGNQYRITLAFYRDCDGVSAPSSAGISISSASCGQNLSLTLNQIPGTGQEVSPICSSMQTTCAGGSFPGIQEWVYEGVVTLPAQCTDWLFSYNLCCRNGAITNTSAPSSDNLHIEAMLNNTFGCNSSPVFSNKPVPFVCDNQLFCFTPGALDPEYDSLVYSLITPMTSSTSTVNYTGLFSPSQPLSSSPAVTFNSATGDLCMTPTNSNEVTVTAIRVEQWDDGVLIGFVMRDVQINVVSCTNTVPEISGFDGNPPTPANTQITVCSGATITETISSNDVDGGQFVSMNWNSGIPGGNFVVTGSPHPTGTFTWTPTNADQSSVPYCFTVTVQDDNCPYNASFTQTYCVTVKGLAVNAGPATTISCDSFAAVTSAAAGGIAPYTYSWDNGASGTATVLGCGIHEVDVVDSVGCTGLDTVSIFCFNSPVAGFLSDPVCLNNATAFSDTSSILAPSTITGWEWDFGDGSTPATTQGASHIYTNFGTFGVKLVVINNIGCADSIVDSILVKPAPVAMFSSTSVCVGDTTYFTDASTVGVGTIVSWSWFLGDSSNTTSSLQNPSMLYSSSGTFNTTLVVTSDSGCPNIINIGTDVHAQPVSDFTWTNVCLGDTSKFIDASSVANATINTWAWDFGDSSGTASWLDPAYLYSNTGTYFIELIVSSNFGCVDTIQHMALVFPNPLAGFTSTTVCATDSVQFIDTSTVLNGNISGWQWSFDDGDSSFISDPEHVYSTGGTYNVALIVTTDDGCSDTTVIPAYVNYLPQAGFTSSRECLNDPTTVTDTSLLAPDSLVYAIWDFGDGSPIDTNPVPPEYIYSTAGTYDIELIVIGSNGCSDTVVNPVIVDDLPIPDFSVDTVCFDELSLFVDLSTPPIGDNITDWLWDFGDAPATSTTQEPSYLYPSSGGYTVMLTVTTDKGCSDFVNIDIGVYALPPVNFTYTPECPTFETKFYPATPTAISWSWDYGDGGTSSTEQDPHIYLDSGMFDVQLIIVDDNQCTDSITLPVRSLPEPIADFFFSPQELSLTLLDPYVTFTNTSTGAVMYDWEMGDGFIYSTFSDSDYVHIYPSRDTGRYIANLIATNMYGCQDSIRDTVIIQADHIIHFPNAFSPNGDGVNETFFPRGIGIVGDDFQMTIYDRWGDNIFKSDEFTKAWDGYSNKGSKMAQQDVYVWFVKLRGIDGDIHQYIGHVTLVK